MVYIIRPTSGLSNRFRVILSYYEKMIKTTNETMVVVWQTDNHCPGFFTDYFENIPNVHFTKNCWDNNFKKIVKGKWKYTYDGCYQEPNYKPDFSHLKLLPHMKEIIDKKMNVLNNNYIAVHIRRTDHAKWIKTKGKYEDDNLFLKFIDENIKENQNIYVATDCLKTYAKFKDKYKDKIKFDFHKTENRWPTVTSLKDAIIDLFMCANANNFRGTYYSSYSGAIESIRTTLIK